MLWSYESSYGGRKVPFEIILGISCRSIIVKYSHQPKLQLNQKDLLSIKVRVRYQEIPTKLQILGAWRRDNPCTGRNEHIYRFYRQQILRLKVLSLDTDNGYLLVFFVFFYPFYNSIILKEAFRLLDRPDMTACRVVMNRTQIKNFEYVV